VTAGGDLAARLSRLTGESIARDTPFLAFLKRPGVALAELAGLLMELGIDAAPESLRQLEIETKYEGYIRRQDDEIAKIRRHETIELPEGLQYAAVAGLSRELAEKLTVAQPATLARAARIPGMTPAALSLLLVHARKLQGTGGPGRTGTADG
jgi:tRNA uridine 5-carboxymethylaminomethyl modification enzyme